MPLRLVASATPSLVQSAVDLARQSDADPEFIRSKVGVETRAILASGETGISLAAIACRKLFASTLVSPNDIGLLIFVTQNPDRRIPHNAPGLAAALGLSTSLASFDLSLGCSGYVYGLSVAEAFLSTHAIANALVVTCDPYSRIIAPEDKATNLIFGDAATASWVSATGTGGHLSGLTFGTDGSLGDAIRIDAGGAALPFVDIQDSASGIRPYSRDGLRLKMVGRDVFNFVNSVVPHSIAATLEKANLTLDDIDWFALHQGSRFMIESVAKRMNIPTRKLLMNIDRYGNTVSSSIPLLLDDLAADQQMVGKRVLLSGFGVGLSWASGVLTFD